MSCPEVKNSLKKTELPKSGAELKNHVIASVAWQTANYAGRNDKVYTCKARMHDGVL